MISFCAWGYLVYKYAGPKLFLYDTFGNKANPSEVAKPIYIALFAVFFAVGCIDIISIVMRLLSLSLRLFGNNFGGEVLLVSQFTLYGDASHGNRPSFTLAERPERAEALYEFAVKELSSHSVVVKKGIFGADMKIEQYNDGPVTILLEN